jgi:hypothetical protein
MSNVAVASRPASLYIAQIEDERLGKAFSYRAYLDAYSQSFAKERWSAVL